MLTRLKGHLKGRFFPFSYTIYSTCLEKETTEGQSSYHECKGKCIIWANGEIEKIVVMNNSR